MQARRRRPRYRAGPRHLYFAHPNDFRRHRRRSPQIRAKIVGHLADDLAEKERESVQAGNSFNVSSSRCRLAQPCSTLTLATENSLACTLRLSMACAAILGAARRPAKSMNGSRILSRQRAETTFNRFNRSAN